MKAQATYNPRVHSLCKAGMYKTFINGEEVLALTDYEGTHQQREGNVFLLNAAFKDSLFTYPMKARLDVRMLRVSVVP